MNLKNILEYDGKWHKKGKDGNCEPFTMRDLKDLLEEQKKEFNKVVLIEIENLDLEYKKYHGDDPKLKPIIEMADILRNILKNL